MALTKSDIDQIRKVVREELELESENIRTEIGSSITMNKIYILDKFDEIIQWVKNLLVQTKRGKFNFEED